jgi:integrase
VRPRATIIRRGKTYSVVIDRGKDPLTGKRRRDWYSGYETPEAAHKQRTKLLRELDTGTYIDPSKQTVAHYLREDWLPLRKPTSQRSARGHRGKVSLATWTTLRDQCEHYVIPYIWCAAAAGRDHGTLDSLYDELETSGGRYNQGLAAQTVLHVHRMLHKAFKDAVRRGKMGVNPAALVDPPRAAPTDLDIWTVEQLRTFLDAVNDDEIYAAWLLFATTGMRRGEVAGLAREDLQLDRGRLRVQWTLGIVDGKFTWKRRPKTKAGERVIALDPATVDALRRHLAKQAKHRLIIGSRWPRRQMDWRGEYRDDPVFAWPDGSIISPDRYSAWFIAVCEAAGLRRIRLHDVRHTYASVGLRNASGWHEVKVISQRLGHSSIGFTLDTYAHVLPSADEQTAHTLARHILEGTAS